MELNTLLVPVDFSETSQAAVRQAVAMAVGEDCAVILLHVIDRGMIDFAHQHQWGVAEKLSAGLRATAEAELAKLVATLETKVEIQKVVCEGTPFVEILRKAEEFQVDAVLMGKHGMRGRAEKLMFGSTTERVIRWASRPVLVLPPIGTSAPAAPPAAAAAAAEPESAAGPPAE